MQRHLAVDMDRVDAIIDLSNVVRETKAPHERPADLGRLGAVIEALAAHFRDDGVLVYAVADESLLCDRRLTLTRDELGTLDAWAREGLIEVQDDADPRLLELAELLGAPIVSNDDFLDFHRTHTWIPGNRDRFLAHERGPGTPTRVRRRVMAVPEDWRISRKEEQSRLKAARLYDARDGRPRTDILRRTWSCPVEDCSWFGARGAARTGHVPLRSGAAVVCPLHREPLLDQGPRPACAQIKVVVDGRVRRRFLVEEGREVRVGRAPDGPDACELQPWLDAATSSWTSRTHVVLRLGPNGLTVRDHSTNGTRIRRSRDGEDDRWLRGTSHVLRPREVVVVHDRIILERSGRTFVFDDDGPSVTPRPRRAPAGPTMMINPVSRGPRPRRRP